MNRILKINRENFIYILFRMGLLNYIKFCYKNYIPTSIKPEFDNIDNYVKIGHFERTIKADNLNLQTHFTEKDVLPEFLDEMSCHEVLDKILDLRYELEKSNKKVLISQVNTFAKTMESLSKFRHILLYHLDNLICYNYAIICLSIVDLNYLLDELLIIYDFDDQNDELFNHIALLMLDLFSKSVDKIREILGNFYSNCKRGSQKNSVNICSLLHFNIDAVFLHNDVLIVQIFMKKHLLLLFYLIDDQVLIFQSFDKKRKTFQKSFKIDFEAKNRQIKVFNCQLYEFDRMINIMHYYFQL